MPLLWTNNLRSIKYYGTLRRYNWTMLQCRNFMRNLCDSALMLVRWLRFHFKRMQITGLGL